MEFIAASKLEAQQDIECEAGEFVLSGLRNYFDKIQWHFNDLVLVKKYLGKKRIIKKGTLYMELSFREDDEMLVYNASIDADEFCIKNHLYPDILKNR